MSKLRLPLIQVWLQGINDRIFLNISYFKI